MSDSLAGRMADLNRQERRRILRKLTPAQREALRYDWSFWGRPEQQEPPGDWTIWLMLSGRGFGKTRGGAETVRGWTKDYPRLHLVGRTAADVRDVMIEGESGILNISPPGAMPKYEPSKRRVTWPNGCIGDLFSADEPDQLRGPQCYRAWAEELASWKNPMAWDNLLLGTRLGTQPKIVAGTTPRPVALIKELLKREGADVVVTRGSTYDNEDNLAPKFFDDIVNLYKDTRIGRQEIYAELLTDTEGALWTWEMLEAARLDVNDPLPAMRKIVVAVDPSWGTKGDECGIIVAGLGFDKRGYVLDDRSLRAPPNDWGNVAWKAFDDWKANEMVVETAFGAETVRQTMKAVARDRGVRELPFTELRVSRGKLLRAEPVVALYEQGKVSHIGRMAGLEEQMTSWVPGEGDSPDRVDALVWALTQLMLVGSAVAPRAQGSARLRIGGR